MPTHLQPQPNTTALPHQHVDALSVVNRSYILPVDRISSTNISNNCMMGKFAGNCEHHKRFQGKYNGFLQMFPKQKYKSVSLSLSLNLTRSRWNSGSFVMKAWCWRSKRLPPWWGWDLLDSGLSFPDDRTPTRHAFRDLLCVPQNISSLVGFGSPIFVHFIPKTQNKPLSMCLDFCLYIPWIFTDHVSHRYVDLPMYVRFTIFNSHWLGPISGQEHISQLMFETI